MLFTVSSYSTLVLKKHTKKIRETIKLKFVHEKHFVERKNEGRKSDKNPSLELFKNSISGVLLFLARRTQAEYVT